MPACGSLVGYFPSKRAFFAAIVEEEGAQRLYVHDFFTPASGNGEHQSRPVFGWFAGHQTSVFSSLRLSAR
jgi:hypothetical protein